MVALVDTFYLAGRVINIDHGEGVVSAYFHLSRPDVTAGDTVPPVWTRSAFLNLE